MNIGADKSEPLTAIYTDLGAIFVSLELSRSSWLITSLSPGGGKKMSKHSGRPMPHWGCCLEQWLRLRVEAGIRRISARRTGCSYIAGSRCPRMQVKGRTRGARG